MITQWEMTKRALEIQAECVQRRPDMRDLILRIGFKLSTRMTSCAGKASPSRLSVKLSVPFFADPGNFQKHFFNTVTHEIAHILAPPTRDLGRRKRDVHGLAWERMHKSLGGDGKRCHSMQLAEAFQPRQRNVRQPIEALCPACGKPMQLGPTQYKRHLRRVQAGLPSYRHSKCPR
jgi:hypothetical protein